MFKTYRICFATILEIENKFKITNYQLLLVTYPSSDLQ